MQLRQFGSFYALPESGCDAVTEVVTRGSRKSGTFQARKERCGATPCRWIAYSHQEVPGTELGARLCSDHVGLAKAEDWWSHRNVDRDAFAVWEVMTT